jgi:hypothetical protein
MNTQIQIKLSVDKNKLISSNLKDSKKNQSFADNNEKSENNSISDLKSLLNTNNDNINNEDFKNKFDLLLKKYKLVKTKYLRQSLKQNELQNYLIDQNKKNEKNEKNLKNSK